MAIIDNHPTFSYCSYKNMMIIHNGEKYSIQNSYTNLKYVYWEVSNPYTLTATNNKKTEVEGRYLVFVNEKGIHTLLPYEDLIVSFDGDNPDLVVEQILGIYEDVEEMGERFVAVETNIEGITQTVGKVQEEQRKSQEEITQIKQTTSDINLSVSKVTKEFLENKELNDLREKLNKSIIDYNSDLGIFKSKVFEYIKDEKISSEEKGIINTFLDTMDSRSSDILLHVAKVISIAEEQDKVDKVSALKSAKIKFENAVTNLRTYLSTAISDNIIVPSEVTGITDMFAKCNTAINLLKNTCDDVVFLGVGGSISTELARIGLESNEIFLSVEKKVDSKSIISAINMSPEEIKINSSKINITGFVTFSDLSMTGKTTINGSNITTGTLNTSKVNIKGGTTKKIVIANDNYCVYDGGETDVNRKIFVGFRTNTSANVPSVILGYNGINPNVDGAVTQGGTYTTYSHYPNTNNPEKINMSYGALAFKYGADHTQFSTFNMYQNGEIDIKAGSSIKFRPNLRGRNSATFVIGDIETISNVPFLSKSSFKAEDGKIDMYYGMLYFPQVGVWKNGTNITIGECRLQGLTSLHLTNSASTDSATLFCKNTNFSSVSYFNEVEEASRNTPLSAVERIMSLNVIETNEGLRIVDDTIRYNKFLSNSDIIEIITDEERGTITRNIDVFTTISTLCKAIQELKQGNEKLIGQLIKNKIIKGGE